MSGEAKLYFSVKDGVFEVSGSELFVSQQIENFKDYTIQGLSQEVSSGDGGQPTVHQKFDVNDAGSKVTDKLVFNRVLHFEGNDVKIIKKMSGTNNSQKSQNTALVYLWAKRSVGEEAVSSKEVRDECESQGCLDTTNHSSHIKGAKEYIVVSGQKGSSIKTYKLTIPGIEKAEELLTSLNEN